MRTKRGVKSCHFILDISLTFGQAMFFLLLHGLSLIVTNRATLCYGTWTSHCGSFSCCRAQALGCFSGCSTWAQ